MKLLIIEDEPELRGSMEAYLKTEGYLCETAGDVQQARSKLELFDYDCILLDVALPDGNGLELLTELKIDHKTDGVIIISARNSIEDRIKGLDLGADDYISKPFHLSELNARVAAVIRRRRFDGYKVIVMKELTVDLEGKCLYVHQKPVELTRKEFDLLLYLVSNKNRVISKNAIAEHLTANDGQPFGNLDFLYTHIKNIKRKLTAAGCNDYIRSIYGIGYKFEYN